jgi:hypothetical protein
MQSALRLSCPVLVALLLACSETGSLRAQTILREVYTNITGSSVANLTGAPSFPLNPSFRVETNLFEGPVSWADNYGTRMRGYVLPPSNGLYTFWIASDDNSELYLSGNDQPFVRVLIGRVNTFTSSRQWTKETNQQSAPVFLAGGQRYYIEALQKEGTGGDNLAVGWQLPEGTLERPIPGSRLQPWIVLTTPPAIVSEPADATVFVGGAAGFSVGAVGAEPLAYQWYRDGSALDGEIDATLLLEDLQLFDHGATFFCVVSNALGSAPTRTALLSVLPETNPPITTLVLPVPGATVQTLAQIEIHFSEAVAGVETADLLVNGQSATNVAGALAGPYTFQFAPQADGPVTLQWREGHGITDTGTLSNAFAGGSWSVTVDSAAFPAVLVITEFNAANESGLRDEDGELQDWVEIQNRGAATVDLLGWALSDDADQPGQWVFPGRTLAPGAFLVVFASGKDRRPAGTNALHTGFRLASAGEHLGLYRPESPRAPASGFTPEFPEQRNDVSCGLDSSGALAYFQSPTPGQSNGTSSITGVVAEVHFSVGRGTFNFPFTLRLSTPTPGAEIRYTLDGSAPTPSNGMVSVDGLPIAATTLVRAAAFRDGLLPSLVGTHSYFFGLNAAQLSLPILSIVTDSNHLFGPTGIIGIGGGFYSNSVWYPLTTNDYHNPSKTGIAWERPTSAEWIRPSDNSGFQIPCGLRVQGSTFTRPRYTVSSKFSYRLYFRGDYGPGRLEYPFFTNSPVESFDVLALRAGHNDISNPFIKDELVRRLILDLGEAQLHGNFAHLFVNGVLKGYYNPCERVENGFLQSYHGGSDDWDVITVNSAVQDGDAAAWTQLRNFVAANHQSVPGNYVATRALLDVTNFADYLLVNGWCATRDWPHNNWRAGRERAPGGLFRFYVWDAEGAFGTFGQPVTYDVFNSSTNIGGETLATGTREIARLYQGLTNSAEWKLLFADRVHKAMFNDGPLTEARVSAHFSAMQLELSKAITNMNLFIQTNWVPQRRSNFIEHLVAQGLFASSNAPVFSQHGGRVPAGFLLAMTVPQGVIYYTTNGADPRVPFTGAVSADARAYTNGFPLRLDSSLAVKARTLHAGAWSALTEAAFTIGRLGAPLRVTELMYNPVGGDAFEFLELRHAGPAPFDLSGYSFEGIQFIFPQPTVLLPGQTIVLASGANPAAFAARYPGVAVFGYYNLSLANGGERLALLDRDGQIVLSLDYDDGGGWPGAADGAGPSLVVVNPEGDLDDPANWRASAAPGGTPGIVEPPVVTLPLVRLNELMADIVSAVAQGTNYPDWIELFNGSTQTVSLAGWSLSDDGNPRKFVLPTGAELAPGAFLVLWCDADTNAPGLHTGFSLDRDGEAVFLYDAQTNLVDALRYGLQLPDYSVGCVNDLTCEWSLTAPTPGLSNAAVLLAAPTNVVINEWLANPPAGADDWIELYNRDTNRPASLGGLYLANAATLSRIRPLSFIAAGGFRLFLADEHPGADHLDFKLPASGSIIALYNELGETLNAVTNAAQPEGLSRGRRPDGATLISDFTGRATPGAPNFTTGYLGPVLNEILARSVSATPGPFGNYKDWIELFNPRTTNYDLSGHSLSVDEFEPGQWRFPAGSVVPGRGFLVLWCDDERPASTTFETNLNLGRALEGDSGGVYLFEPDGQMVDSVEYGFQVPDGSIGRVSTTWRLMTAPTPGASNAPLAALGAIGSLRLNEWMASPLDGDDWFELFNTATQAVNLAGLFLTDDPSAPGQFKFSAHANSWIGPRGWIQWRADGDAGRGRHHVNFSLNAGGEALRLYQAGTNLFDAIDFGAQQPGVSEGRYEDGAAALFAFPTTPTPGAMNRIDSDLDFMPDDWESLNQLDPMLPDAVGDADSDGASNLDEFRAGTDPRDAGSVLRLHLGPGAGVVSLAFTAQPGKSYSLLARERVDSGPWRKLKDFSALPLLRQEQFEDASTAGTNARFYRLVTPRP